MSVYCITGIDTDIGKSYATGLAARWLARRGRAVVTQKMAQTGTLGTISDDILLHRKLMGIEPLPEDHHGATCAYIFRFPASPHLAAEMENRIIDPTAITAATRKLLEKFDVVLLEGAGGLNVPLRRDYLIADYLQAQTPKYPLIIVTSGRLGSINHTLLTLEAAARREIPVAGIVFNHHPPADPEISADAANIFRSKISAFVEIPEIDLENVSDVDFTSIFE